MSIRYIISKARKYHKIRPTYVAGKINPLYMLGGVLGILIFTLSSMPAAAAPSITEYSLPTAQSNPYNIATGSDGALWFAENSNQNNGYGGSIGRITTSGAITQYALSSNSSDATDIVAGPDGNLWFTQPQSEQIGKISPSGSITEYSIPITGGNETCDNPYGLTVGPDGNLWYTEGYCVGKITTSGVATIYPVYRSTNNSITAGPDGNLWFTTSGEDIGKITTSGTSTFYNTTAEDTRDITAGPDGNLWFTDDYGSSIYKITTSGTSSKYTVPTSNASPWGITTGPNGALWFTEKGASKIGQITTAGVVTEYSTPSISSGPAGITTGSDGALWFTESTANNIGRITTGAPTAAPTNLTAPSPTNQAPALTWTAVSGASSYDIYRNGVNVGSSTTNSFTDTSLPSDGTYSYYVTAVNPSGESSASSTISVVADTTPPTITYTATPVADSNGYNSGNVLVTFTCSDALSGVASCTNPVTVPNEGVGQSVTGMATDKAGNTATVQVNPSLLVNAVNAGGDTEGAFSSDTGFNGGTSYSTTNTVDTSSVNDPAAPQAVYQSARYGNTFSYTFSNLTPNKNYTLMLHFNELYWGTSQVNGGGIGNRVFNVAVNGQTALSNFDIYKTAGGANKAVVEQVAATADSNGNMTVNFTSDTDNAMVSGLALYDGTLPAESPNALTPPVNTDMIDTGGTGSGNFVADTDYTGGSIYTTASAIDTSNVSNPAPQEIYQSDRYGNSFSYDIPNLMPNTSYNVRLDFSEPYWGVNGNGGAGSREFDVSMNGSQVLNNFDVYQTAGGANKALAEDFTTTSDGNGNINIGFTSVIDNAMVSGIEVTPTD